VVLCEEAKYTLSSLPSSPTSSEVLQSWERLVTIQRLISNFASQLDLTKITATALQQRCFSVSQYVMTLLALNVVHQSGSRDSDI